MRQLSQDGKAFVSILLQSDKRIAKMAAKAAIIYGHDFVRFIVLSSNEFRQQQLERWIDSFVEALHGENDARAKQIIKAAELLIEKKLAFKELKYNGETGYLLDSIWDCNSDPMVFAGALFAFSQAGEDVNSDLVDCLRRMTNEQLQQNDLVSDIQPKYGSLFPGTNKTTTIERTVFFVSLLPRNVDERNKIRDVLKQATKLYQSFVFSIDSGGKIPLDNLVRRLGKMKDGRLGQLSCMEFWTGLPALFYADADPIRSQDGFTQRSYDCAQSFLNYISDPEDSAEDVFEVIHFLKDRPKCWHKDTFQGLQNYRAADVATEIRRRTEPGFKAGLKNWLGRHFFSRWTTAGKVQRLVDSIMEKPKIEFVNLAAVYNGLNSSAGSIMHPNF